MTNRAEFERLLDVYGFRCERFGQDLSTHARAQVVSAFAALASAPVAGEAPSEMPTPIWWINHGLHGHITLRQDEADRARQNGAAIHQYHAAPQSNEAVQLLRKVQKDGYLSDTMTHRIAMFFASQPQADKDGGDWVKDVRYERLLTAARGMTKLYPHVWDRSDGHLVVFPENVAQFDAAFDALRCALGESVEDDYAAQATTKEPT